MRAPPRKCLGMCRRVTNKGESGFGIANDRGTVAVEWKHHRCDRLKRRRDLSVEVSVLRGWDPKVLLVRPSPFPSALIQRGDSWPPLPRVELIQKVSTNVGLGRSWFVTTCFLAHGTCVWRGCTLLGYSG